MKSMNYTSLKSPIALFFAINIIFSVYLLSVDIFSAILLFMFSAVAFFMYWRNDKSRILRLGRLKIRTDIFENILSLIPFSVKINDLNGNTILNNYGKMNSSLGNIIDEFELQNAKIIKAKIDNQIMSFFSYQGKIVDSKNSVIAHLCVEMVINDILKFASNEMAKNVGEDEHIGRVVENANDGVALYELNSDGKSDAKTIGRLYAATPSFYNLITPHTAESRFVDLFDISEKKRVGLICESLDETPVLFETLMANDFGAFPVEINANILKSHNLLNLSVRDISVRKENIKKRDRSRILKVKENERMQKIQVLHLALNKANEIILKLRSAIEEVVNKNDGIRAEMGEIILLQHSILDSINEIIHFYSHTDIKTMVNIAELIGTIKKVIFTQSLLHNTSINFVQKGATQGVYCDKNALKMVLIALLGNSLEHFNEAKGSNFYGQINVKLEDLNDESVLLSIEDNGGGVDEEYLERSFDPFYTTREGRAGLGLSACRILVEDLLFGEIMAMNVEDGFRVEIMLPKEGTM